MLVLVRGGTLGDARPLPIPFRGCDVGEVMRLSSTMWLGQEGGVMANPDLILQPDLLGLARPQSFGLIQASVIWAIRAAN